MTTTSTYPNTLPASLLEDMVSPGERARFVLVDDPDYEDGVVVRWRFAQPDPWRCPVDGHMTTADCAHTFAAALLIAEQLLGLTRVPELHPTAKESP